MKFDEVHDDLSRQFSAIAARFIPVLADRSLEVCDLVQDGMILANDICEKFSDVSSRRVKSIAIASFVNYLRDCSRLRRRHLTKEDHSNFEKVAEVLADESAPERLMLRIFIAELSDLLSRFDAQVLDELMQPSKSAAVAVREKKQKRVVTVSEIHLAKAFGKNLYEIRQSIQRVRSAVANEYFLN